MIKHPEEYNVSDQDYVGQIDVSTLYVAPHELLDAVTTNGGFAELMHIVTISVAFGMLLSNRFRVNVPQITHYIKHCVLQLIYQR